MFDIFTARSVRTTLGRLTRIVATTFALATTSAPPAAFAVAPTWDANDPTYARVQDLAREITTTWAAMHPFVATDLGIRRYDGALERPSRAAIARDLATVARWKAELAAIDLRRASLVDRDDVALLRAQLVGYERADTVVKRFEKDPTGPGNALVDAIFTQFQRLPIAGTDGATASDVASAWAAISARLAGAPAYLAAGEALVTHPGHLFGTVGAQQLAGAPDFLRGALTDAAKAQLAPAAFATFVAGRDAALAALAREKAFVDAHAAAWPENFAIGRDAYDAKLRDEDLLPFASADIERMGRDELAHGWAVQSWAEDLATHDRTAIGPATGGGLAPGGAALVGYYRARIAELTDFMKRHDVVDVPSWLGDVRVVETPKFLQPVSPGASMSSPRVFDRSTTGYYFITPPASLADAAKRLDANEDFDRDRILQTAAHEAMPGHFMQLSIAHRHPDFVRRMQDSGVFAEGWAFYGEELFVQLGLYGDDLDPRYDAAQWERVRGARAIVDPELASGTMTYDGAVVFFEAQTGFTHDAARAAVAGIALSPGYVISYTVGRYQLESLLADYRARVGSRASLREFHTRLLCYGTTPFAIVGPELLAESDRPLAEVRARANY